MNNKYNFMNKTYLLLLVFSIFCLELIGQNKVKSDINSKFYEKNPVCVLEGFLFFQRSNHPENLGGVYDENDIYVLNLTTDSLDVTNLKNLNSDGNDYLIGIDPASKTAYIHRYLKNNQQVLYKSTNSGDEWSKPEEIEISYFLNKSGDFSGGLSLDGKTMILSLNSYVSYGNEDLYVSHLENGKWSEPKNLGRTINSYYQEMTPYLTFDKTGMIFASNKPGGKGGFDLYYAQRMGNSWTEWSEPVLLKNINTKGMDFSYSISPDSSKAYYVTTITSNGYGDIYFEKLPENKYETPVKEENDQQVVQLTFINEKSNEIINVPVQYSYAGQEKSTSEGKASILFSEDTVIDIKIKALGFFPKSLSILASGEFKEQQVYLNPLEVGETFQLENVLFERGTDQLLDASFPTLKELVEVLRENPEVEIALSGHTDNTGSAKKNLELSQKRVERVKDYLVNNGIKENRISGRGFGSSRPIASNASEKTRKLNRRVEFTIIKN